MRCTRYGGIYLWLMTGAAGFMALCAVLCAGLAVYQSVSASAPASHLPTPASTYVASGAVVEWRTPVPERHPQGVGSAAVAGGSIETSPASVAEHTPMPLPRVAVNPEDTTGNIDGRPDLAPDTPRIKLPVNAPMTQGFGCSPFYTGIPGPGCPADAFWFHDGVDIGAPVGTPVQAGMAGMVIFAGPDGDGPVCNRGYRGYGLAVIVDGGDSWSLPKGPRGAGEGWQALYAHLSRIDVTVGQAVAPETLIGASGDTGCVSGAHLHFGLRHDGELVDPLEFIQ